MNEANDYRSEAFDLDSPASVELMELCERLCDNTATTAEIARLEEMLKTSASARAFYQNFVQMHGMLWCDANANQADDEAATRNPPHTAGKDAALPALPLGFDQPLASPPLPLSAAPDATSSHGGLASLFQSLRTWATGPIAGSALAVLLLAAVILFFRTKNRTDQPSISAGPVIVARLQDHRQCVWSNSPEMAPTGTELRAGQRLELINGTAKLAFHGGATVVVESPSLFELITAKSMRLEHGTVAVHVSGPRKEFLVVSPDASVVDLGTSFGVHRGEKGATEVEVFEGAVEVHPDGHWDDLKVLGVGASAQVRQDDMAQEIDTVASRADRFANLLQYLWSDLADSSATTTDSGQRPLVESEFSDGPVPGAVDTFLGAKRGRGWLTPWVAAGNPAGDIIRENPLSGPDNLYLRVRFYRSYERAIARQYGERNGFDPSKPHVISWRWRFEGNPDHFTGDFWDRVYFYSNPFFRRNSWSTNGWLIGVVGGDETTGAHRQVFPLRWYVFDGHEGAGGKEFDRRNMVDTGLAFKPGIIYRFAVIVYPETSRYDVAIRDDRETYTRVGLAFRDPKAGPSNVLHFGASANQPEDDMSFSIDSIRIEQLTDGDVKQHVMIADDAKHEAVAK